jgi:hypothetical protein
MKTRTVILASMVLLFCTTKPKAQTFTTGIYLGAATTSVNFSGIGNAFTNTIKGNNIMGFEGGLFERFNLGSAFIKPMLLVSYKGGTVTYYNNDGTISTSKFGYGNIEIPLLFGLRIIRMLRIEAGPVYNWIYASQYSNNNSIKINPSGLGYRVGANVELGIINLGLAYQGLTNNEMGGANTKFSSPNELIFGVSHCFGNAAKEHRSE